MLLYGNYRLEIEGYGSKAVTPTDIFDSEWFAENYHYDGTDLGATIDGNETTFKVWTRAYGAILRLAVTAPTIPIPSPPP